MILCQDDWDEAQMRQDDWDELRMRQINWDCARSTGTGHRSQGTCLGIPCILNFT